MPACIFTPTHTYTPRWNVVVDNTCPYLQSSPIQENGQKFPSVGRIMLTKEGGRQWTGWIDDVRTFREGIAVVSVKQYDPLSEILVGIPFQQLLWTPSRWIRWIIHLCIPGAMKNPSSLCPTPNTLTPRVILAQEELRRSVELESLMAVYRPVGHPRTQSGAGNRERTLRGWCTRR